MDGQRIKHITNEGLHYFDEQDEEQSINFAECHRNNVEKHTTPESLQWVKEANHMTDNDLQTYIARLAERKTVANRNFDGYPDSKFPYIEFYTQPMIRFEFQTRAEFDEVQHTIRKAGWRTFDIA